MTTILAIDPGSTRSAWLILEGSTIAVGYETERPLMAIDANDELVGRLRSWHGEARLGGLPFVDTVVIETIEPWGGFTGPPALETMRWVGRFQEAVHPVPVCIVKRSAVLGHLGVRVKKGQAQAAVRAALMDRYGGEGSDRKGGPLYGVVKDLWSALSVAVAYREGLRPTDREEASDVG